MLEVTSYITLVWVDMVSGTVFVHKVIFFASLDSLGSRQSQNGGLRIFMPLDHLLICKNPMPMRDIDENEVDDSTAFNHEL